MMANVHGCDIVTLQALRQIAASELMLSQEEARMYVAGLFCGPAAEAMVLGTAATFVAFERMVATIGNKHFVLIATTPEIRDQELAKDILFWLTNEDAEIHTNIMQEKIR